MKIIDHLVRSLRDAAVYNSQIEVAPCCVLWPDHERQWESVIERLQMEVPELFVLGNYEPEKRCGPAIWLRCVLVGQIPEFPLNPHQVPIFYLPGVGRQELRAVEDCPDQCKPLAELQYRGTLWSQVNTKDWTILAYLKSDQGGLALDVAQDNASKSIMKKALYRLLDEDIDLLRGKRLNRDYFNTLLSGDDPNRDVLLWINDEHAFRVQRNENQWLAFVEICHSAWRFNPHEQSVLEAAAKLAQHEDASWTKLWKRYCESPEQYPNISKQIRKCKPPRDLTWNLGEIPFDGWPQWNEDQEKKLRVELLSISELSPKQARKKILEMEKQHAARRELVWAKLHEAPLVQSLEFLTIIAQYTESSAPSGNCDDLLAVYRNTGWQVDDAVLRALSFLKYQNDVQAISAAVRVIYLQWMEDFAIRFQKIVDDDAYPLESAETKKPFPTQDGDCILFVDGLRFDLAKRLQKMLESSGFHVASQTQWAALPSITATGKPAVSPVCDKITGSQNNVDFEPILKETQKPLRQNSLKKLLIEAGWSVLDKNNKSIENTDQKRCWCEFGNIDKEGHTRGWKLAKHLEELLLEIQQHLFELFEAGWQRIHLVTDHGWLFLPGGLPKTELHQSLTQTRWGRCASLKSGAKTKCQVYPWFWNPELHFALAPGVSCFRSGEEYAHGGLSLQECLTLHLTVSRDQKIQSQNVTITFDDILWKGLRCTVVLEETSPNFMLDIRINAATADSSIVYNPKTFKKDGKSSVVVENDDLEGIKAFIVVLDSDGNLLAQEETIVGGE